MTVKSWHAHINCAAHLQLSTSEKAAVRYCPALNVQLPPSDNHKADKAQIFDNTYAKVISKRLPNLDAVADAKLWELAWLDCSNTGGSAQPSQYCIAGCKLPT